MTKPSWKDLHRATADGANGETDDTNIRSILQRIGATRDGKLLRNWLMEAKVQKAPPASASDSALRDDAADRRIAVTFTRLLEPKIDHDKRRRK